MDPTVLRQVTVDNQELVDRYLFWLGTTKGRSPETVRSYTSVLRAWLQWVPEGELLSQHRSTMSEFVNRPRSKRGGGGCGAPRTVRRDVTVLREFYRFLNDENVTTRNLAGNLEAPRVTGSLPKPIADDIWFGVWQQELTALDRVMLGLGYYVGLRRKEIVGLTGAHVGPELLSDFERKGSKRHTVEWATCVRTVTSKLVGHRSRWTDLFADDLMDVAHMTGDHPLLSPWSQTLRPRLVNRKLEALVGDAFTPHQLRHSFGTNMVRSGVPLHLVSELMNHGSLSTTMLYIKVAPSDLRVWLDGSFDMSGGSV